MDTRITPIRSVLLITFLLTGFTTQPASGQGHEGHGNSSHMEHDGLGTELMAPHMLMTQKRPVKPADEDHADMIIRRLRTALEPYKDHNYALAQGYRIFLPQLPQEEYHFNHPGNSRKARTSFDIEHPTSLLYRKTGNSYELSGVMYTAPPGTPLEELDKRVPFSLTQWHAHVNICMPPSQGRGNGLGSMGGFRGRRSGRRGMSGARELFGPNAKFGPRGSISTEAECHDAGGKWRPQMFGWMVHVYPFRNSLEEAFEHSPGHSGSHHGGH